MDSRMSLEDARKVGQIVAQLIPDPDMARMVEIELSVAFPQFRWSFSVGRATSFVDMEH